MTLSRLQKISIVCLVGSLLPAYLIANWRHSANLSAISEQYERESQLQLSTEKLLIHCEDNEKKENDHYNANHQICEQGLKERELSKHTMDGLNLEKANNDQNWYRNFALNVVLLNLLGLLAFRAHSFLNRD